jgi:hypothetical protein
MLAGFDDGSARITLGGSSAYDYRNAPDTLLELVAPGRGGVGFEARMAGLIDASDDSRLTTRFKLDGSPVDLGEYADSAECNLCNTAGTSGLLLFAPMRGRPVWGDDASLAAGAAVFDGHVRAACGNLFVWAEGEYGRVAQLAEQLTLNQ